MKKQKTKIEINLKKKGWKTGWLFFQKKWVAWTPFNVVYAKTLTDLQKKINKL